ncbi:hypothetical protein [Paenibacillus taichungensis]
MTYEEAKSHKQKLEEQNKVDSDKLKVFDIQGKSANGLTPDHVRALPEWKSAKTAFDRSFAKLRDFNGWFVKKFKKEIAADRRERNLLMSK